VSDVLKDQLNAISHGVSSQTEMTEIVSYNIWGAAVTTTRAFDKVTLKLDANTCRVFVCVSLRWWARFDKFKRLQDAWIKHCERRVEECLPTGWKSLVYYEKNNQSK
jgi:hypothetical protein